MERLDRGMMLLGEHSIAVSFYETAFRFSMAEMSVGMEPLPCIIPVDGSEPYRRNFPCDRAGYRPHSRNRRLPPPPAGDGGDGKARPGPGPAAGPGPLPPDRHRHRRGRNPGSRFRADGRSGADPGLPRVHPEAGQGRGHGAKIRRRRSGSWPGPCAGRRCPSCMPTFRQRTYSGRSAGCSHGPRGSSSASGDCAITRRGVPSWRFSKTSPTSRPTRCS